MNELKIPLPNGELLKFRRWNEKGPNHLTQNETIRTISKEKEYTDLCVGIANQKVTTLFADFDQDTIGEMTFDQVRQSLAGSKFTLINGFSNTPKGALVVSWNSSKRGTMSKEIQEKTVRSYLPKELKDKFDTRGTALSVCKVGQYTVPGLMKLRKSRIYKPVVPKTWMPYTKWWNKGLVIKELNNLKPTLRKAVDVISCLRGLEESFDISQGRLGASLSMDQRSAGRLLKQLIQMDLLEIVDKEYIATKKAITYRAKGALVQEILYRRKNQSEPAAPTTKRCYCRHFLKEDPKTIVILDHTWGTELLNIAKHFHNPYEFKEYALQIPGVHLKDRITKIDSLVAGRLKWIKQHRVSGLCHRGSVLCHRVSGLRHTTTTTFKHTTINSVAPKQITKVITNKKPNTWFSLSKEERDNIRKAQNLETYLKKIHKEHNKRRFLTEQEARDYIKQFKEENK